MGFGCTFKLIEIYNMNFQYSQSTDLSDSIIVRATTTTYTSDDLCGARANVTNPLMFQDPGYFHTSLLKVRCVRKNV